MTEAKRTPDWEAIERHYRAGLMSLREIAAADGNVTEGAIRKRAKRDLWTRNLAAKIQQKADELVRKEQAYQVREPGTQLTPSTERQEVESSAQVVANVRLSHQGDIGRARRLFQSLLGEIEDVSTKDGQSLIEQLANAIDCDDDDERQKRIRQSIERVCSMTGRVDNAKKLTEMLEKLVRMEREAFGIKDDQASTNATDDLLMKLGRGEL